MATSVTELTSRHLSFSFGSEPVLRDIDIGCPAGGFVSILGASGCGKSTLLRIFAGLLKPTSGSVSVAGGSVGFVFQHPTLCPWLTVTKNVQLPLKLARVPKRARARSAEEAIQLVGLAADDAAKLPRQLSGGMQMRVSLARALVTRPKVMLMDEPFSALDEVLRQQMTEICLDLWRREAWTTLFVTHNVAEAVFMSQRIFILAGKPAQVVDTVDIHFPDRTDSLRLSAEYVQLVTEVSRRLRLAVERSSAAAERP